MINYVKPHPCGYLGDPGKPCRCLPGQINQYSKRISGPIIDRIDLHIEFSPVTVEKLTGEIKSETSKAVRKRIQRARDIQTKRYKKTKLVCNSDLNTKDIKELIPISSDCVKLLRQAVSSLQLSARTYYRTIKTARTIADLGEEKEISTSHIAEALQYRPKYEN